MTEKLKTLLHEQASDPHFAPVDLDALVADGDRRIRRRRWSGVAAGAVAAVAVAAVAPSVLGGTSTVREPAGPGFAGPPPGGFPVGQVTWSVDSVIHHGDTTVDVGMPVDAFVLTGAGFVVASGGEVWEVDGDEPTRIGTVDAEHPRLVSDDVTGWAAWIDTDGDVVGFDHGSGTTTTHALDGGSDIYALDDRTAYVADARGVVALDLTDGTADVVPGRPTSRTILDVQDGLLARSVDQGTAFGSARATELVVWEGAYGSLGSFSSDSRYYTTDADEAMVYDVARGQRVDLDLGSYWFSTGYGWTGERTVAVLAMKTESAPMELLTCRVPEGDCTPVTTLGTEAEVGAHVQLPVGQPIGD